MRRGSAARHLAHSFCAGALLLIVAYPGVTLFGGSLAPSNLGLVIDKSEPREPVPSWPDLGERRPNRGVNDMFAAAWQYEPGVRVVARALSEGRTLVWNPWSATGMPGLSTAADCKTAPRTLLAAFFGGGPKALTWATLLAVLAGVIGVQHLVGWYLGQSRLAAVAAAAAFLLNGFAVSNLVSAVADPYWWSPWLVVGLVEACRGGLARIALAAALELPFLAATFLPVQVLCLLTAFGVVLVLPPGELPGRGRRLLRMIAATALAASMLAVVLTPIAWGLLLDSNDLALYADRELARRNLEDIPTLLAPRHAWDVMSPVTVPPGINLSTLPTWVGLVPLVLVVGAWRRIVPIGLRNLCGVGFLLSLLLHFGTPVVSWIALLPGLRPIAGWYWPAMTACCLSLLVGLAVDPVRRYGPDLLPSLSLTAVACVLFGTLFIATPAPPGDTWRMVRGIALAAVLVGTAGAVLLGRRRHLLGTLVLLGVGLAELVSYPNHARVVPFDIADSPPRYLERIRELAAEEPGAWRVLSVGNRNLQPEWGAALGVHQLGTLNLDQNPAYRTFYHRYVHHTAGKFLHIDSGSRSPAFKPSALNLASVRLVAVDEAMSEWRYQLEIRYPLVLHDHAAGILLFENPGYWPRARLVDEISAGPFEPRPFRLDATWSEDAAWVDEVRKRVVNRGKSPGTARLVGDRGDVVTIDVTAERPAVLVLADAWHPRWRAFVNGRPKDITRVDQAFRGVVVPAGHSRVQFRFRPNDLRLGRAISSLALVFWLGLATVTSGHRPRVHPASRSTP